MRGQVTYKRKLNKSRAVGECFAICRYKRPRTPTESPHYDANHYQLESARVCAASGGTTRPFLVYFCTFHALHPLSIGRLPCFWETLSTSESLTYIVLSLLLCLPPRILYPVSRIPLSGMACRCTHSRYDMRVCTGLMVHKFVWN